MRQIEPIKILGLSDSILLSTGFATVSYEVFKRLNKKSYYDISFMGHALQASRGPITNVKFEGGEEIDFRLFSQKASPYCADIIQDYVKTYKPDIQWTLLDTFMVMPWYIHTDFTPAKTVFYFTSDGEYFPKGCEQVLMKCDYPIAMSKFGQAQVKKHFNIDAGYIPHGVDTKTFCPLSNEDKEGIKAKYGLAGKFVVGWVARNQLRKMLDRGLKAFVEFAEGKDDVVLFIHSDPRDMVAGNDLINIANRFKIANKIRFSGTTFAKGFPRTQMPEIYQAMDVFFLSTSGEGWGIPTIEAMSCEVPVVITDYTTTKEIVTDHDAGIAVPLVGRETPKCKIPDGELTGTYDVERGLMSINDAVDALNILYANAQLRKKYGKNGRIACKREYEWDDVAEQWDKLFRRIME